MRSTNRKRALLVSASVILLCMTVIVGMTWALFTDTVGVQNHLQAGDLNITLERINLETYSLNNDGYLATTSNNAIVNFSNSTTQNVFGLTSGSKIVPRSYYIATMQISNNTAKKPENAQPSDVAYDYWLEVKLSTSGLTAEQLEALKLDEQLRITVWSGTDTNATPVVSKLLSEGLTVGSSQVPIGTLSRGGSNFFTVKMEFVDNASNNLAKTQSLTFDLIVHATQRTTAP